MIASAKNWFLALSQREKILIGMLAALSIGIFGYYGVIKPFSNALDESIEHFETAFERKARIETKVALLNAPRAKLDQPSFGSKSEALDVIISRASGEAGFAVGRIDPQSGGRVNLVIDSAKPTALFGWLSRMEAGGILTENLSVNPGENDTVSATVSMRRVASK